MTPHLRTLVQGGLGFASALLVVLGLLGGPVVAVYAAVVCSLAVGLLSVQALLEEPAPVSAASPRPSPIAAAVPSLPPAKPTPLVRPSADAREQIKTEFVKLEERPPEETKPRGADATTAHPVLADHLFEGMESGKTGTVPLATAEGEDRLTTMRPAAGVPATPGPALPPPAKPASPAPQAASFVHVHSTASEPPEDRRTVEVMQARLDPNAFRPASDDAQTIQRPVLAPAKKP